MLSGVMLIIVTMFAVLGAYYLSDLLTNCLFRRRKGISRRHSTPYAFRKKPCLMNSPCIWPFRSMRGNIPSSSFSTRSPLLPQAGAPGSNRPFQSRLASRSHGQDTPFRIAGSTHEEGTIRRR